MIRRTVFRATLGVLAGILFLTLVAAWVAPRTITGFFWRSVLTRAVDEKEARRALSGVASRGGGKAPESLRVLRAEVVAGRDATYYYKAQVDPVDVPAFKSSIASGVASANSSWFSDNNDFVSVPGRDRAPGWWDPRSLGDPDVVSGWEWIFIFSPKTGAIYAIRRQM